MLLRFYLQLNFMKKHTKLLYLRSNLLQSLYRICVTYCSQIILTCVIGKTEKVIIYGIYITNT